MPVSTLPEPDPRLAEPLRGFWNLPGIRWLLPSTSQDQAGSMGQPMGMAEPLAARAVGLAIALPEYLQRFGKKIPFMQDWSQALPGLYRGYRAALPGVLGASDQNIGGQYVRGGTFIARDLPYAQQYAANIPSGGGGPVVHDVLAEVRKPLSLEIPEHRQALARAEAVATRRDRRLAPWEGKGPLSSLVEDMLDHLKQGFTVRLPKGTAERLRAQGFDAVLMPRELEGQYPTMIHLRPEGIRMTPRSHEEAEPAFATMAKRPEGMSRTVAREMVGQTRMTQADQAGITEWAQGLPDERRLQIVGQLRRLMSQPGYFSDPNEATLANADLWEWARTGSRFSLEKLVSNPDVKALPLLSRTRRWETRAPTGARPMKRMEMILNHPARTIHPSTLFPNPGYSAGEMTQALVERAPEADGLRDYLGLLRDQADQNGLDVIADKIRGILSAKTAHYVFPEDLYKLLYEAPEQMARGAFR